MNRLAGQWRSAIVVSLAVLLAACGDSGQPAPTPPDDTARSTSSTSGSDNGTRDLVEAVIGPSGETLLVEAGQVGGNDARLDGILGTDEHGCVGYVHDGEFQLVLVLPLGTRWSPDADVSAVVTTQLGSAALGERLEGGGGILTLDEESLESFTSWTSFDQIPDDVAVCLREGEQVGLLEHS